MPRTARLGARNRHPFSLHTGQAVVGSVGARARRLYTAIGDTVSVCSRLEGMTKEFVTSILASGVVRAAVFELFEFRAPGTARAKGRVQELVVYELVGNR